MDYRIYVTVDFNDGDEISKLSNISNEELKKLRPLIKKIKDFKPYEVTVDGSVFEFDMNFNHGDSLREDLGEKTIEELYGFNNEEQNLIFKFCPYYEHGFHSIVEVLIMPDSEEETLLSLN